MEIRSLIILAAKADSEGNFRVADRLTANIETMSRVADLGRAFRGFAKSFIDTLSGLGVKRATKISDPVPAGYRQVVRGTSVIHIPEDKYDEVMGAIKGYNFRKKNRGVDINQEGSNNAVVGGADDLAGGTAVPGAAPGTVQQQTANPIINNYLNSPIPGAKGKTGNKGRDGADGAQGIQGLKGDTGPQGPAGKWWPGVVAGLLSGAIGTGGVAAWLASKGADSASIRDTENHLGRLPQYQMMTRRTESGDLTGAKAIQAQNFVDTNSTNPRLKNQRDWYNFALQESGGDKNFANNVIALVKATPQMPSSIGGGTNI
jgi:hypothetical protein